MAYVVVPDGNLDVDDPIRSADIKQLNNNVIDHEARILAIEDPHRVDVHFERDNGYTSGVALDTGGAGAASTLRYYGGLFNLYGNDGSAGSVTITEAISGSTTDEHFLEFTGGGGGATKLSAIRAVPAIYFANRTGPVTCIYRMKVTTNSAVTTALFVGFHDGTTLSARPANGVFLEIVDATNWRFTMGRSSAYTTGTSFTPPTAATWFEVKVILDEDAGNHAECYVDDVLKSDLSGANLPTDRQVFAALSFSNAALGLTAIDRFRLSASGIDNAA